MPGPRAQRRLDINELERFLIGCDLDVQQFNGRPDAQRRVMAGALAHRIGRSAASVHRWRKQGIPFYTADQIAIEIGAHPFNIWSDFYREEELCHT